MVTGPIIIAIGLILAPSAINNCATSCPVAIIALVTVIVFNIWGRGMAKIVPILLGIIVNAILPGNEYVFPEDVNENNDKFQTYKL